MNKKAKSSTRLKRYLIITVSIVALLTGALWYAEATKIQTPAVLPDTLNGPTREGLLQLVNQERAKAGVAPLIEDARLDTSAQLKADDMVKNNYYGHIDAAGKHGYSYIDEQDHGSCKFVGENINISYGTVDTSAEFVDSWMHSPPHRAAILDSRYAITGFGIADNKVVEHFCQPA